MAAGPRQTRPVEERAPTAPIAPAVSDLALGPQGTLKGQVVDGQGRGLDGASVSIRQDGQEVAKTLTNRDGFFSATNLRGGTYEIVTGQSRSAYRVWTAQMAPPAARDQALIVAQAPLVRGQYMGPNPALLAALALGITATVFAIINYKKTQDLEDKIDQLPSSP
jgi:hypothetical protein